MIPDVRRELKPWMDTHPDHIATRALRGNARAFESHVGLDPAHEPTVAVAQYYVNLLGLRKILFSLLDSRFHEDHGRMPDSEERRQIRLSANNESIYGPRAHLLAKKGSLVSSDSPNFYTDEILVTTAAMWGLERSREVVLLTKDEDLQEQHYKLLYLIDTHYRGMLLAGRLHEDPKSLVSHSFDDTYNVLADAFEPCDGLLVERTDSLAADLLPRSTYTISLHCWVVGQRLSTLTFAADSDTRKLLAMKGKTRGLNTDLFDGRNCHFWLAPLPLAEGSVERRCAAIARDKMIEEAGTRFSLLDLNQALVSIERFTHIEFIEPEESLSAV